MYEGTYNDEKENLKRGFSRVTITTHFNITKKIYSNRLLFYKLI
jgi:hypothetical protein